MVARVTERTAGNPFFVREVARLLSTRSGRRSAPCGDRGRRRGHASLPSRTRRSPCWARPSLIGRGVRGRARGQGPRAVRPTMSRVLAPALDAGLVEAARRVITGSCTTSFAEHLQAGLAFDERRTAHARLSMPSSSSPGSRCVRPAWRPTRWRRYPAVSADDAAPLVRPAAAEATAAQAYDEAVRHLEAALAVSSAHRSDERELALAEAMLRAGQLADARECAIERVAARAVQGSARRLGSPLWGCTRSVPSRRPLARRSSPRWTTARSRLARPKRIAHCLRG